MGALEMSGTQSQTASQKCNGTGRHMATPDQAAKCAAKFLSRSTFYMFQSESQLSSNPVTHSFKQAV